MSPHRTLCYIPPMLAAVTNLAEYTVTELAFSLKRTVEDAYGLLRVRGELSGFKRAGSGHLYFTLKDEKACIDAVAWRGSVPRLAFEPADGLEVICTGRLTTYPGRSKYQLVVERIEPAGMGALMALLEERRKALAAEGLFDVDSKRPLPWRSSRSGTNATVGEVRGAARRLRNEYEHRRRAERGRPRWRGQLEQRLHLLLAGRRFVAHARHAAAA